MKGIIVGENASGKTVFIKNRMNQFLEKNIPVLSNMQPYMIYETLSYNTSRIKKLKNMPDVGIVYSERRGSINIIDSAYDLSDDLLKLLTLICKEGDILLLDEPELGLSDVDIDFLIAFLERVKDSFKDFVLVTHCDSFSVLSVDFYTVDKFIGSQVTLRKISESEMYDFVY